MTSSDIGEIMIEVFNTGRHKACEPRYLWLARKHDVGY